MGVREGTKVSRPESDGSEGRRMERDPVPVLVPSEPWTTEDEVPATQSLPKVSFRSYS